MTRDTIRRLPKTDLHVHLDGSLRLPTLIELARERAIELPSYTDDGLRATVFRSRYADLGEYLDLPVRTYSSGMFMRLAFAITTSVTPDIIVMDEMIGTGDAQFIQKARQRLNELLSNTKILVLATHNGEIGIQFCNKALWLEKGKIRRLGPTQSVLNEYLNFVG